MGEVSSALNHYLLLLICIFSFSYLANGEEKAVGYGYSVGSVHSDSTGKWLEANLHLLNSSSVYGPDIPDLILLARYGQLIFPSNLYLLSAL
ncbi:hypothetical protein SLEP1_g22499 [Rubroshorea leprosula]|uniref:Uncharacterized protein n=1 Tax=Rubroshorea leprosula TaxID=152421 RepID=A0AAV5JLE9_9ROSI|nr:hypothetical protein SLEP1_g22499 [Rubroshorea leprosula]